MGNAQSAWPAIAEIKVNAKKTLNKGVTTSVKIPQSKMSIEASSEHPDVGNEGLARFAIDGNPNTIWHTNYNNKPKLPQDITINLNGEYNINKYSYLPRTGSENGIITKYEIHVSTNGKDFEKVAEGNWDKNSNEKIVEFDNVKATHVKLVALEGVNGFATAAELNVYSTPENISLNDTTKVSANVNNEAINNVKDNDTSTSWKSSENKSKVVTFDLESNKDILGIEILNNSNEALKYKVEYSKNNEDWIEVANRSNNNEDYSNYVEQFDKTIVARYVRVTLLNEVVDISEIKIYKGDATEPLVKYISDVTKIYESAIVGDKAGNYTQEGKDALESAIRKANEELAKDPDSLKVAEIIAELKKSVSDFRETMVSINRVELAVKIDEATAVLKTIDREKISKLDDIEKNIIESAIDTLRNNTNSAITIYETVKVGQSQIDLAYENLKLALDKYLEVADEESRYNAIIAIAKEKVKNAVVGSGDGQYSKESVDKLKNAISKAESDFGNVTTVDGIATIIEELQNRIDTFDSSIIRVNKEELKGLIIEGENALIGAEGVYTPNAIKEFKAAIKEAKGILNNINSSQENIDKAIVTLTKEKEKFEKSRIVDKSDLSNLIKNIRDIIEKLKSYDASADIISELENLISSTNKVIGNDNATTEEVNSKIKEVTGVIEKSKKKLKELAVNRLNLLINKAQELNSDKYTSESWGLMQIYLNNAKDILKNEGSSLDEIEVVTRKLEDAINKLVIKTEPEKPEEGNGDSGNSEEGNGDSGNSEEGNGDSGNSEEGNGDSGDSEEGNGDLSDSNIEEDKVEQSDVDNENVNKDNVNLPSTGQAVSATIFTFGSVISAIGAVLFRKKK